MQAIIKYFYPFYFIYEVHLLERKQIDKWMHNTKFADKNMGLFFFFSSFGQSYKAGSVRLDF